MSAIAKTKSVPCTRPIQIFEGTLDATSVSAASAALAEQDFTVTGIKSTDMLISFTITDAATIGIGNARVKADNTVAVLFLNTDDAAIDPAGTLNYRVVVIPAI